MPLVIPVDGKREPIKGPLTLTTFKTILGGPPEFIDLSYGDILVVNSQSWGQGPINLAASRLAGLKSPIYGSAIVCSLEDIA